MAELHRVLRTALSERTQLVHVAEHVGQRDESIDRLGIAAAVGALDLATTRVDVADDVAEVVLGVHELVPLLRVVAPLQPVHGGDDVKAQRRRGGVLTR